MFCFRWNNDGLPSQCLYRYDHSEIGMVVIRSSRTLGALVSASNRNPDGAYAPIVDGPNGFLPDLPSRLITTGRFNLVDFIGGHCTGDGNTFVGGTPSQFVTDDDIRVRVFSRWPAVVRRSLYLSEKP